jgi:hypothetical protein
MKNDGESTLIPSSLVTRSKVLRAPFVSSASTATPKSRDVATIASGTDDKGDNTIAIFEHEEREYLEILLLDLPQSLQLRQLGWAEMRVGRLDLRVSAFDLPEVDEMVFFFPSCNTHQGV